MTPEDPAKGEDGSSIGIPPVPPGPPPGTETLTFWQRSGTRLAIGVTYGHLVALAHFYVERWFGLGAAVAVDSIAFAWGVACGINVVGGVAIRKAP